MRRNFAVKEEMAVQRREVLRALEFALIAAISPEMTEFERKRGERHIKTIGGEIQRLCIPIDVIIIRVQEVIARISSGLDDEQRQRLRDLLSLSLREDQEPVDEVQAFVRERTASPGLGDPQDAVAGPEDRAICSCGGKKAGICCRRPRTKRS